MSYNETVKKLTPRHYRILDLCLTGLTPKQISKELGMSQAQVSIVINSPSFQHQFAIRRASLESVQNEHISSELDAVKETLRKSAKAAADKLIYHMNSPDSKISLKSATEILDRTGYSKEQKLGEDGLLNPEIVVNSTDLTILRESFALDSQKPERPANATGS